MNDVQVVININLAALQGVASQKLQRLLDVIHFSRAGASLVTDDSYPVRGDFFQFQPSGNTRLPLDVAREASEEWHVLHALREALESASGFLEEARRCCALYQLTTLEKPLGADLHRVDRESRQFHRLGLPLKIQRLRDDFGVESGFGSHIVSLNEARNCIVHRDGVVTATDVAADGHLTVSWSRVALMARSPDGLEERLIEGPQLVQGGWSIVVGTRVTSRAFALGERVVFTFDDLVGMVWSHVYFVNTVAQAVQRYAEGLGIPFKSTEPAV